MPMREPGYIAIPFAASGERLAVPVPAQPGGQISMTQGWTEDYQKDMAADPNAKPIDRRQTNQLFYLVTQLLQRWQGEAVPEWIDPVNNGGVAFAYPFGAIIRVPAGSTWVIRISLFDGNVSAPNITASTAQWLDPLPVLQNAVLTNTPTAQDMIGPLNVGAGSKVLGAMAPRNASDNRIATMEWIKNGSLAFSNSALSIQRFPYWLGATSNESYFNIWGFENIPWIGGRVYEKIVRLASGDVGFNMAKSAITVTPRVLQQGNTIITASATWYDPQQIRIGLYCDNQVAYPANIPVQYNIMGWTPLP